MTTLNLNPVLDALGGTTTTPAVFKAEARRAGRRATRVNGAEVTFATELIAVWDGTAWNTPPTLYALPVDCYWNVKVQASGNRLELNGILPDGRDIIDFGEIIAITPDTGTVDTGMVAQYQATQRFVSNQVAHIDAVSSTVFDLVATVQAQIETAAAQVAAARIVLANLTTAQAGLDADVTTVVTAATQTAADRVAIAADRTAVEALVAGLTTGSSGPVDGNSAGSTTIDGTAAGTTIDGNY